MTKWINVKVQYDPSRDQIVFDTPGGVTCISATNDGPTWKSLGEHLVREVKAFGKDI